MKKGFFILLLFSSFLILSSCNTISGRILYSDDESRADARMKQILEVLKDKDKEGLKKLFSKQALKDAKDFNINMDYLFEFFHGKVDCCIQELASSDEEFQYGKRSIMLRAIYTVNVDKNTNYMFFIIDYPKDSINTDNEGLYTLRVIKAEDEDKEFTYYQDMKIAGIYKPKD